jgi:flagellar biosynthesis protein
MPRPPRHAIALEYDGASAPRVAALGHDALAEQIIALAREHGVPLVENRELAGLLAQLDLGDAIPETLYLCIAQIIAFAYRLQGRVPAGWEPPAADAAGDTVDGELS